MSHDNSVTTKIKIPSNYTTTILANKDSLLSQSMSDEARYELTTGFESVELTSTEHRTLFAIFCLYSESGLSDTTIQSGVVFTPYELCKAMGYKSYGSSSFPGSARHEALDALNNLSSKQYRCLFTIYKHPATRKITVIAIPNKSLLEVHYEFEGATIHDVGSKIQQVSPERITAKVCTQLVHATFWRPMDLGFYDRLRSVEVRVQPEHWLLQYWLMRSTKDFRSASMNVLLKILKLDQSKTHRSRQRDFVLKIFKDFKNAGYLSKIRIDRKEHDGQSLVYLHKQMNRY